MIFCEEKNCFRRIPLYCLQVAFAVEKGSAVQLTWFCDNRFRLKYHPEAYNKRQEATRTALQKRCEVFNKLLELNHVASFSLDVTQADSIVTVLDAGNNR